MKQSAKGGALPPMPGSDENSLEKNKYDGFYSVRARDFWGENEVNRIKEEPFKKCSHKFKATSGGVICTKCNFGLIGPLEVRDDSLFFKGKLVSFK